MWIYHSPKQRAAGCGEERAARAVPARRLSCRLRAPNSRARRRDNARFVAARPDHIWLCVSSASSVIALAGGPHVLAGAADGVAGRQRHQRQQCENGLRHRPFSLVLRAQPRAPRTQRAQPRRGCRADDGDCLVPGRLLAGRTRKPGPARAGETTERPLAAPAAPIPTARPPAGTATAGVLLVAVLALGGCGDGGLAGGLRAAGIAGKPDEFMVLPTRPLEMPANLAALPPPTPGQPNRVDYQPMPEAIAGLSGRPGAPGNADGAALVAAAGPARPERPRRARGRGRRVAADPSRAPARAADPPATRRRWSIGRWCSTRRSSSSGCARRGSRVPAATPAGARAIEALA